MLLKKRCSLLWVPEGQHEIRPEMFSQESTLQFIRLIHESLVRRTLHISCRILITTYSLIVEL